MKDQQDIKPGDWVRFYSSGRLVIGIVQYVRTDTIGYKHAQTDVGETPCKTILEVR